MGTKCSFLSGELEYLGGEVKVAQEEREQVKETLRAFLQQSVQDKLLIEEELLYLKLQVSKSSIGDGGIADVMNASLGSSFMSLTSHGVLVDGVQEKTRERGDAENGDDDADLREVWTPRGSTRSLSSSRMPGKYLEGSRIQEIYENQLGDEDEAKAILEAVVTSNASPIKALLMSRQSQQSDGQELLRFLGVDLSPEKGSWLQASLIKGMESRMEVSHASHHRQQHLEILEAMTQDRQLMLEEIQLLKKELSEAHEDNRLLVFEFGRLQELTRGTVQL